MVTTSTADPIATSLRDPILRLGLVGRYLALWIAPVRLHLHHVIEAPGGLADPSLWRTFAALGAVAAVTTIAAKRRPRALLPVAWFGASLAPVLLFTPSGTNIFSERYLYIPSIGLAVLLSAGIEALIDLRPRATRTARGGIVVVLVFLAALTLLRTTQWTDEDRLLRADLRTEPRAAPLAVKLGLHLRNAGREEETLQLYEETLQAAETGRPLVLSYLDRDALGRIAYESGLLLLRRGLVDSAETQFHRSLRCRPGDERTLASLGALLGSHGRCEEARPILEGGLRLHPRSVLLRENLALCLMHLGETVQARQLYEEILEIDPDHQTARRVLGGSD